MTQNRARGKKIAITGGIGTGKSTVCRRIRALGGTVISADEASRAVVAPGSEGLRALVARYGPGVLGEDGALNRKALADIIFNDEKEREALNAILHPLMRAWMDGAEQAHFQARPQAPLFLEIPLLVEAGMQDEMDEVWLVRAAENARIARIMQRDGIDAAAVKKRMQSQLRDEEKARYAHRILDNSGDETALRQQVDALYHALMKSVQE